MASTVDLPVLYLKNARGQLMFWQTWAEDDVCVYKHGIVGGKSITHRDRQEATNVGRANQRTAEEQACFVCQSAWTKKTKAGYRETEEQAMEQTVLLPMKGWPIRRTVLTDGSRKEKVYEPKFPAFVQRKLNGLRCLAEFVEGGVILRSSLGTVWDTLSHIEEELYALGQPGDIFDGEIYLHGTPLQTINSWIKNRSDAQIADVRRSLQYHIFDVARDARGWRSGGTWLERLTKLQALSAQIPCNSVIQTVSTYPVTNQDEVRAYGSSFVGEGYEGLIIRQADWPYCFNQRVEGILKWKDFITAEFQIVSVVPREHFDVSTGAPRTICDKFVCRNTWNDDTFEVVPRGSLEEKESYWEERDYIVGERLVVRFLERSIDGIPQGNPVGIAVRLDDDYDGSSDEDDLDEYEYDEYD